MSTRGGRAATVRVYGRTAVEKDLPDDHVLLVEHEHELWRLHDNGALAAPVQVTVRFNGVLVQNDFELRGETVYVGEPRYFPHGDAPIKLQAHNDPSEPIAFRNIWVRPLP